MAPEELSFPDVPRADLDRALDDLVTSAAHVRRAQGRLRALLRATQSVAEEIELPAVLKRLVQAAVELVGAKYCAIGVVSPQGGLQEFIFVGMPPEDEARIGHLPEGHGLLGALIDDPRPIRLPRIGDDARSVGFPPGHPPMQSFLGVPVRTRTGVFGNLYLTDALAGTFSEEDEQLVLALAATAGYAIENARLLEEARIRARWMATSAELSAALLSTSREEGVELLVAHVLDVAAADRVSMVVPGEAAGTLTVRAARGIDESHWSGRTVGADRTVAGAVLEAGASIRSDSRTVGSTDADALAIIDGGRSGPMMTVPLIAAGTVRAMLVIARGPQRHGFSDAELDIADDLAARASVALELARARTDRQRLLLLEDRSRIAQDLHDHVIQQLFGTGLGLQNLLVRIDDPDIQTRIEDAVAGIDGAIDQIRGVIFALTPHSTTGRVTARHSLIDIANESAAEAGIAPTITFRGPVDLIVADGLLNDVAAVVRECLTNIARHAHAATASVTVSAEDDSITITVEDDGVGIPDDPHESGLHNIRARATHRGGSTSIESRPGRTVVTWMVPVSPGAFGSGP